MQLLAEHGQAQDEDDAGREELHEAEHRVVHPPRGDGEHQQWHGGEQPAEHDREGEREAVIEGRALWARPVPRGNAQRGDQQDRALDGEARQRADRHLLAQQAVGREAEGEGQADPQGRKRTRGEDRDPDRSQRHRDPLRPAQPLLEDQRAEQDVDQRIDVIAKAGRIDFTLLDRPDVDEPVHRNEERTGAQHQHRAHVSQSLANRGKLAAEGDDEKADRQRPDNPPADEFERGHLLHQQQVQGHEAPYDIGAQCLRKAGRPGCFVLAHECAVVLYESLNKRC